MTPQKHFKLVRMSPLVGFVFLVLAMTTLGLLQEKRLTPYLLVTAVAMVGTLCGWFYSRWFLVTECPVCATRVRMEVGEESVTYRCSACSNHTMLKRVPIDIGPVT